MFGPRYDQGPALAVAAISANAALAKDAAEPPACERCGKRQAVKTDGESRWVCRACLGETHPPIRNAGPRVGRNEPCRCGRGKKFKNCCQRKERAA